MMNVDEKYKKWGWGAVIGLVGIILIAGLIIAATLGSGPKPSENVADNPENGNNSGLVIAPDGGSSKPNEKPADKPATKPAEKPATKPAEKPADKPASKPADKPANKPANGGANKPSKPATKPGNANDLPKSGPSNILGSFVLIAIAGTLLTYKLQAIKR